MNKPESISQRIRRIAVERDLTFESLTASLDINVARLDSLWRGLAVPEYKELAMLAKVLEVDEAVLQDDRAGRFWFFLRKKVQELHFLCLWPQVEPQTGLRGPDASESDEALFEELLQEHLEESSCEIQT